VLLVYNATFNNTSVIASLPILLSLFCVMCSMLPVALDCAFMITPSIFVGCMEMVAKPGEYTFTADGSGQVCGLYVISPPDQVVELEFVDFDVPCETALIAVSKLYL